MRTPKKPSTPTIGSGRLRNKPAAAPDQAGPDLSQFPESTAGQSQLASERRGTSVKRRRRRPSTSMLMEDGDTTRHLFDKIMQREPAKSPVVGKRQQPEQPEPPEPPPASSDVTKAHSSVPQEQPPNSTHNSSKRLKKTALPQTPKDVLKHNLKERLRSSMGKSQPMQENPVAASMLLADEDTPRHLFSKILLREPAKSPVVANIGPSKLPESPAESLKDATLLSQTEFSSLDLPDVTVANLANTAKVSRKRPRRSFNVTGFEKRLQVETDAYVRLEPLDVQSASSMSLSQFLSVSTVSPGKGGLQRKVSNPKKRSEDDVANAIKRWDITAINRSEHNSVEISSSEVFATGQSQLPDYEPVPETDDEVVTSQSKSGAAETQAAIGPYEPALYIEEPMIDMLGKTITVDETLPDKIFVDDQDGTPEDVEAPESPQVGEAGSFSKDDVEGEEEVASEGSSQLEKDENVVESEGTLQDEVFTDDQDGDAGDSEAPESPQVAEAGSLSKDDVESEEEVASEASLEKDENVVESEGTLQDEVFTDDQDGDAEAPESSQVAETRSVSQDEDVENEEEGEAKASSQSKKDVAELKETFEYEASTDNQDGEAEDEEEAPESDQVGEAGSLSEDEEAKEESEPEVSSQSEQEEILAESLNNTEVEEDQPEQQDALSESEASVGEAQPVEESEDRVDATESMFETPDFVRTKRVFALPEPLALTSAAVDPEASATGSNGKNNANKRPVKRPRRKSAVWEKKIFSKSFFVNTFKHYAGTTVAKDVYPYLNTTLDKFYSRLMEDLETYANHAGRSTITAEDALLLLRRQGHVTDKVPVEVLIEKYLPMEHRRLLLPTASRAMLASKKKK